MLSNYLINKEQNINKNNPKILKENCCSPNIMDNGEIPNIFF